MCRLARARQGLLSEIQTCDVCVTTPCQQGVTVPAPPGNSHIQMAGAMAPGVNNDFCFLQGRMCPLWLPGMAWWVGSLCPGPHTQKGPPLISCSPSSALACRLMLEQVLLRFHSFPGPVPAISTTLPAKHGQRNQIRPCEQEGRSEVSSEG